VYALFHFKDATKKAKLEIIEHTSARPITKLAKLQTDYTQGRLGQVTLLGDENYMYM
jgi:hypothetical protein